MESRITRKASRTAQIMCFLRASSFYESESCLKTDDYIAPQLLPKWIVPVAKIKALRAAFMQHSPPGAYEYVIARTRFIDSMVESALASGISQVVLLGAGYDSRSIRFHRPGTQNRFFELDAAKTQATKVAQLKKRKLSLSGNTVYIPIDFNKEDLAEKLTANGFRTDHKSLFILEGIVMYLEETAVRETFKTMKALCCPHSLIVADFIHASVLRRENALYGEQAIYERINKYNEAWRFGLAYDQVETFMTGLGLKLMQCRAAEDLETEFHFDSHRINGTHFITVAETI
jgi:methyltransferase (TIGR00027 family)